MNEARTTTLSELASLGVAGYRSLARWAEVVAEPAKDRPPGAHYLTKFLGPWDALALQICADLRGEAVPVGLLAPALEELKNINPALPELDSPDGAYIAILKDEKNKVIDAVAVALNPRAIERLARRGHRMVFLNAKDSARRISEKLARISEEEQIEVA